jgi:hypothetical protein
MKAKFWFGLGGGVGVLAIGVFALREPQPRAPQTRPPLHVNVPAQMVEDAEPAPREAPAHVLSATHPGTEQASADPSLPVEDKQALAAVQAEITSLEAEAAAAGQQLQPAEQARRIRLPLIMAIRGDHPTPEARHRAMREALERSGPTNEVWTGEASSVFGSWASALPDLGQRVDTGSTRCFLAGCEIAVTFPDRASYDRAAMAFRDIYDEAVNHGGRVQTPPVTNENGSVRAVWMMLRPDVAPPQAQAR